ncbi:MAG: hypothetical protein GY855_14215 [candidate division Zixibacteria bacterium]|nr:hypothetical protein [candidate division Zixibacteria bacterium]
MDNKLTNLKLIFNHDASNVTSDDTSINLYLHWMPYKTSLKRVKTSYLLDELIGMDGKREIDQLALSVVRNWYRLKGKEISDYLGISIGELSEYYLTGKMIELLRIHFALNEICKIYKFKTVSSDLSAESEYYQFVAEFFEKYDIRITHAYPDVKNPFISAASSYHPYDENARTKFRRWAKECYYDFKFRSRRGPLRLNKSKHRILFSSYRNESLVLEYLDENYSEEFVPILDRKTILDDDIHLNLLSRGANIFERRTEIPSENEKIFAEDIKKRLQSNEYLKYITDLTNDKCLSLSICELISTFVSNEFSLLAAEVVHYRRLFIKYEPTAVVVYNDTAPHQKLLVKLSEQMGIPSLLIQHGYHAEKNDGDKRLAPYLAVWGNAVKQQYVKDGRNPDSIVVTGNPYHEPFLNPISEKRGNFVLIITNPENRMTAFGEKSIPEKYMEEVVKAIKLTGKDLKFVVKLHPSESLEYYNRLFEYTDMPDIEIVKNANLIRLLRTCQCVILPDSTVYSEAYLCRTPMIALNITGKNFEPPLNNNEYIRIVENYKVLAEQLNRIIEYPRSYRYPDLNDYIDTEGESAKRIAEFVMALSSRKGNQVNNTITKISDCVI